MPSAGICQPACSQRLTLGRAAQQRRVRIVDMQEQFGGDVEIGQRGDGAAVAGHRQMSHRLPGLVAEPGGDHFVVAPHRAVEQHQRRAGQPRLRSSSTAAQAATNSRYLPLALSVMRRPSVSPAPSPPPGWLRPSRYQAPLPATANGSIVEARSARRRAAPVRTAGRSRSAWRFTMRLAEHVEDAVGVQDRKHPLMRVDRERRSFAHRQQPGHRVDLTIGEDHAGDRAVAQRVPALDAAAAWR